MNYTLSKEATIDIENIWLYTFENWSIEQADRYLDTIFNEIEYLCVKPQSGFDFSNVRKGYFRLKVKSHFIFYKINEKQNEVYIVRVLHEIMDIDTHILK